MDIDWPPAEYDNAFHNWRGTAVDAGILFHALSQYYETDFATHGYAYALDNHTTTVPVATTEAWLQPRVADISFECSTDAIPADEDATALSEFVRPLAMNNDDDPENPDPDDYLWNGTLYGTTTLSLGAETVQLAPMTFYTAVTEFNRLRDSLYRSLYDANVSATDTRPFSSDALAGTPRDVVAPTIQTLLNNTHAISTGCGAVVIVNTGTEYRLLISRRSYETAEMPGWLEVSPAGFLEPTEGVDTDLFTHHVLREYSEEIFDNPESGTPLDAPAITDLTNLFETGDAELTPVVAYVNPEKGHFSVFGVCIIDDPEYYQTHLAHGGLGGWESSGIELLSLSEGERLQEILTAPRMKWCHLPALVEALLYFEETIEDFAFPFNLARVRPE